MEPIGYGTGGEGHCLFLGLVGESGRCKTRVISQLVKILIWRGESVHWVNSSRWQWNVQYLHDDSEKIDAARRIKLAMEAPWLVFDDLGPLNSTERVCEHLYALLEAHPSSAGNHLETIGGKQLVEQSDKVEAASAVTLKATVPAKLTPRMRRF